MSNVLSSPVDGSSFVIAYRVYEAFPGYKQAGAGGPSNTPLPEVHAVDYLTGQDVGCNAYSVLRKGKPPTAMPLTASESASERLDLLVGNPDEEVAYGVAAGAAALTVTGHMDGLLDSPSERTFDVSVRRQDRAGTVIWATQFGTSAADLGTGVAADATGFTILGHTNGSLGEAGKGETDVFVRRYSF